MIQDERAEDGPASLGLIAAEVEEAHAIGPQRAEEVEIEKIREKGQPQQLGKGHLEIIDPDKPPPAPSPAEQ